MARDYARNRSSRRNARIAEMTPRGGRRPSGQRRLNAYRQPRGPRTFFWLITGILMGLLIAGVLYTKLNHHNQESSATVTTASENKTPAKESHKKKSVKSSLKTSEKQVEDSAETATNTADDDPEIAELASNNSDYDSEANTSSSGTETDRPRTMAYKSHRKQNENPQPHYDFYTMLPKNDLEASKDTDKEKSSDNDAAATRYQLQVGSFIKYEEADHLKAQLILQGYNASIQKHQREGAKRYRVVIGPFNSSKAANTEQQRLNKSNIKSILAPL